MISYRFCFPFYLKFVCCRDNPFYKWSPFLSHILIFTENNYFYFLPNFAIAFKEEAIVGLYLCNEKTFHFEFIFQCDFALSVSFVFCFSPWWSRITESEVYRWQKLDWFLGASEGDFTNLEWRIRGIFFNICFFRCDLLCIFLCTCIFYTFCILNFQVLCIIPLLSIEYHLRITFNPFSYNFCDLYLYL